MDLDQIRADGQSPGWARVGMLVCFAVAAVVLLVSIWMPRVAKANDVFAPQAAPAVQSRPA